MMIPAVALLLAVCVVGIHGDTPPVLLFDDSVGEGRQFDGIGGLSGGGATSKLLVNYPQKQRDEILDYLFKPNFGASLQILKVEIGGDAQSTDGTEASHMHNPWDENYERGYEWWLMMEAKKRNPKIKLTGLPWTFPAWIGDGKVNNPYTNPQRTADYIVNWVKGANDTYGLTIDMLGIWNERPHNVTYIKTLRRTLDNRGFNKVQLITSDCATRYTSVVDDVYNDKELQSALYAMGFHYPGTVILPRARSMSNLAMWSSEDYSSNNNEHGGACWARLLNRNYVNGLMTSTISWNLIAAYYKDLPYAHCGLMDAMEPWSGNYEVASPIWMSAHTTQFTEPGWFYLQHGSGVGHLPKGGSYVSLRDPDDSGYGGNGPPGSGFTIIMETMVKKDAHCIRGFEENWTSEPQTVTLKLGPGLSLYTEMNVWYSHLTFDNKSTLFQKRDPIKFVNNTATITLGVNEVWTLTTVKKGQKGSYDTPPASKDFPLPYSDDFESYDQYKEAANLAQQTGSFEVIQETKNKFIRQMVLETPVMWCNAEKAEKALNVIGDGQWTDMMIEADLRLPTVNASEGAWVGLHVSGTGCGVQHSPGVFLVAREKTYYLTSNLNYNETQIIKSGSIAMKAGEWHKLSLVVKGNTAQGAFDGQALFNTSLPKGIRWKGFAGIGTDSWGLADFDNLKLANMTEGSARMDSYFRNTYRRDNSLYFENES